MSKIESLHAHEILDSRGNPTVQTTVLLKNGISATAAVPSGASTGIHEALELRDNDKKRYNGKGVLKAVANVNGRISKALRGIEVTHQREIDDRMRLLDGTMNKQKLGANAILGVSLASARAGSKVKKMPLYKYLRWVYDIKHKTYRMPYATMNVLNGGAHADWVIDFQEFMIVPQQKKFRERVRCGSEVFHALKKVLKRRNFSTFVGDEGGYAVACGSHDNAFKFLMSAIKSAGYKPGSEVMMAIDPAASEFYNKQTKRYELKAEKKKLTADQLTKMYEKLSAKYPIISIEDGLDQDDWDGWIRHTNSLEKNLTLVGDDLFVTNVERLQKGIDLGIANAILIKVNQIGTLSEAIDAIILAQQHKYKVSVSHRSGETSDTIIADLAVAVNADFIKTGSLSRSERIAKYNRLMEIEEEL